MKPFPETAEEAKGLETDNFRHHYFYPSGKNAAYKAPKKGDLLTPFLLSIPVIIMLIILIYGL